MTVREAFSLAFGRVKIGSTCHIGHCWEPDDESLSCKEPTIFHPDNGWPSRWEGRWTTIGTYEFPIGPDISNEPAESFHGQFGAKYDAVVNGEIMK